ncbi:TPA: diheme cytochrome c [Pseudomonas aeruginosa]
MNGKGLLLPLLLAPMLIVSGCHADEHGRHGNYKRPKHLAVPADAPEVWRSECSACHIAYPPGLLPVAAWRMQMADLGNHYGSDASLDPAEEQAILDFLARAATGNRLPVEGGKPGEPPRITETRWFSKKHDEIRASTFKRPGIGSAANCAACHGDAEKGDFDEDRVKIPKPERQLAEKPAETRRKPDSPMEYAPLFSSVAENSRENSSCKVTTIVSRIDCGASTEARPSPAALIVWKKAPDGTWECTASGAGDTGLVPKNCTGTR